MKNVTAQEVSKLKNQRIPIINVLPREYFDKEHIPGSVNIPLEEGNFVQKVKEKFPDTNQQLIVHCSGFDCPASTEACEQLAKAGYKNTLDFKGGLEEWREAGFEVQTTSKAKRY